MSTRTPFGTPMQIVASPFDEFVTARHEAFQTQRPQVQFDSPGGRPRSPDTSQRLGELGRPRAQNLEETHSAAAASSLEPARAQPLAAPSPRRAMDLFADSTPLTALGKDLERLYTHSAAFRNLVNELHQRYGHVAVSITNTIRVAGATPATGTLHINPTLLAGDQGRFAGIVVFELVNLHRAVFDHAAAGRFRDEALHNLAGTSDHRPDEQAVKQEEMRLYARAVEQAEVPSMRSHYEMFEEAAPSVSSQGCDMPIGSESFAVATERRRLQRSNNFADIFEDNHGNTLSDAALAQHMVGTPNFHAYMNSYERNYYGKTPPHGASAASMP